MIHSTCKINDSGYASNLLLSWEIILSRYIVRSISGSVPTIIISTSLPALLCAPKKKE